jgi:transposase
MLIRRCVQLEPTTPQDVTSAAVYTLHLLARRILELTAEIHDLVHHITDTITRHCPRLLTRRGVGPDNAAALLITAGDNPDRLRSEASFAALCGALYRIAICRLRCTLAPATTSPAASAKTKPAAKPSTA